MEHSAERRISGRSTKPAAIWKCLLGLVFVAAHVLAHSETVIFPPAESERDGRDAYPFELLKLALAKSEKTYELKAYPRFMLQDRAITELEANRGLDVIWTMTSADREVRLRPIRIPIDKGLLGWRLLLIRDGDAQRFANIGVDKLKRLQAVQGHDWPDTVILRSSGFEVKVDSNYGELFQMLSQGVVDYFPRSAQEIWAENDNHKDLHLAVEPTMAIHYPTAMYFFVNRKNVSLAEALRRGLEAAIADGSFDRLFAEHFSAVISRSRLDGRQIIEIPNPLLPAQVPLKEKRYWLQVKARTTATIGLPH